MLYTLLLWLKWRRSPMATKRPVALITGGARGIGLGIAEALAEARYDLVIDDVRDEADVAPALRALTERAVEVAYVRADVGDPADRQRLIDATRERFGRLNVLVNNAGVAPKVRAPLLEATEESFERVMRINLQGPYFLTQLAARWMVEQHDADAAWTGCIVNISSISSTAASTHRGEYCLSKAALSMATKLWAVELAPHGISVYEVAPGIIKTDMTAGVTKKYDKLIADGLTLQRRWGLPADVGKAVAMLARGDLPYSTGQVIGVDGGLPLPRL